MNRSVVRNDAELHRRSAPAETVSTPTPRETNPFTPSSLVSGLCDRARGGPIRDRDGRVAYVARLKALPQIVETPKTPCENLVRRFAFQLTAVASSAVRARSRFSNSTSINRFNSAGHVSQRMVDRYAHIHLDAKRSAVEALSLPPQTGTAGETITAAELPM
jgi:hypothetical protein